MVYIDTYRGRYRNMVMSHLMADTERELDEMALKLGLKPEWKQKGHYGAHYDVCESKRRLALSYGAKEVTARELVALICLRRDDKQETTECEG